MNQVFGLVCSMGLVGCGSSATPPPGVPGDAAGAAQEAPVAGGSDQPPTEHNAHGAPGAAGGDKCEHLAKVCHDHAAASPLVGECHKVGHAGDSAKCEARHDECMSACEAAAEGGAHPHPAGGAASAPHH